jgi:hypothetical protein
VINVVVEVWQKNYYAADIIGMGLKPIVMIILLNTIVKFGQQYVCMKKLKLTIILCSLLFVVNNALADAIIPLGGNAWVTGGATIDDDGLSNWTDSDAVPAIYFRVSKVQKLSLFLRLRVPSGTSSIIVSIGKISFNKKLEKSVFDTVKIADVTLSSTGYVKVELKGISKTGAVYADVSDLIVKGVDADNELVYVKTGSSFHFGRRGPSVHLRYPVPTDVKNDVHWFYNEITVPKGNDVVGSYFMADGFGEGYFGMQVNSDTERRVLFSVWSPFDTQDPKSIPDSMKIVLLKKGALTNAKEFGSEGSGGQSYMLFPWQAGKTYGFLLNAEADPATGSTTYTTWFKDVAANKWYLVASFRRPKTVKHLSNLYSFLENFIPENGDKTRMGLYNNQWIADGYGNWQELCSATYTYDATAKGNYRKDYAGGVNNGQFYLKNAGFFNGFVPANQSFNRPPVGTKPNIIFKQLPQN